MSLISKLTALLSPLECKSKERAEKTNCPFISRMRNALTDTFSFSYRTDVFHGESSCPPAFSELVETKNTHYFGINDAVLTYQVYFNPKKMPFSIAHIFICAFVYISNLIVVESSMMDCIVTSMIVLIAQVQKLKRVSKIKRY